MQELIEIELSEQHYRKFIHVSYNKSRDDANLHIFWPYSTGGARGISTDNTCKTLEAPKEFVRLILNDLAVFIQKKTQSINRLRQYSLNNQIRIQEKLIQQAQSYIEALNVILQPAQNTTSTIRCLYGTAIHSFGEYPEAMQSLFRKNQRNMRSMRFRPDEIDTYTGTVNPGFSVKRPAAGERNHVSPIYDHFSSAFKTWRMDAKTPNALKRQHVAMQCFNPNQNLRQLIPLLARNLLEIEMCYEKDQSTLEALLRNHTQHSPGHDEVFTDPDDLGAVIRKFISTKYKKQFDASDFFKELDFYTNDPSDQYARATDLTFMLQFFLGESCLYAQFLNITSVDFAGVVERDYEACRSSQPSRSMLVDLTNEVKAALSNDASVEKTVFAFIHKYQQKFGLSRQLTAEDQQTISDLFKRHYQTIVDTREKDEFTLHYEQEPGKKNISYAFGNYLAFHLIDILKEEPYASNPQFNSLRNSVITGDIPRLASTISNEEQEVSGLIKVSKQSVIQDMQSAIANSAIEPLRKLLLKTSARQNIFEILGADFFRPYYQNQAAQNLFEQLRGSIDDEATAATFNEMVRGDRQRLQLTIDHQAARSLHAALEDRRELSVNENGINRVLEYDTPQALSLILRDLSEGERDSHGRPYYCEGQIYPELAGCRVTQNDNGTLSIDASEEAVHAINQIIEEYRQVTYVPMATSASVYKIVAETLGVNHSDYLAMMNLFNNNEGDPTPYRFMQALNILCISYAQVTYNNTLNQKPYLDNSNRHNPHMAKKGGSGFIIRGLRPEDSRLLEQIRTTFTERLIIDKQIRGALYRKIHELGGFKELIISNMSPKACLEHALLRLGIEFTDLAWSERTQDFVAILPPREQAKLRVLTKSFYPDDRHFPALNNEDKQYTQGHQFALRAMNDLPRTPSSRQSAARLAPTQIAAHLSGALNPTADWVSRVLSPEQLRSVYAALQDRTDLPLERVLRYHTAEAFTNVLNSLYLVSCRNTQFDAGLDVFANFKVSEAGQNGLQILAPVAAMQMLDYLLGQYYNTIHLSMDMNAGIYKTLSEQYGDTAPEIVSMNRLNNNTQGDPTPYKIIRALELLLKRAIPSQNIRYNNTMNDLEYQQPDNKDNGLPKKAGSGFIVVDLTPQEIALIEACTEKQAYVSRLDTFYEQAILDTVRELNMAGARVLEGYPDRKDKLEAALIMFGFRFKNLQFSSKNQVFTLETDLATQSCIKKIMSETYGPVDKSIVIFNKEDAQRFKDYKPSLIPGWNQPTRIQQVKNESPPEFPPVLPYRHYPTPSSDFNRFRLQCMFAAFSGLLAITSGLAYLKSPLVALHLPAIVLALGAVIGAMMLGYYLLLACLPPQSWRNVPSGYNPTLYGQNGGSSSHRPDGSPTNTTRMMNH